MGKSKSSGHRIDADAKLRFLEALRAGAAVGEAARRVGFSAEAFYGARRRDPLLKLAWIAVVELSAEEERQRARTSSLITLVDGVEITPNNRRGLQKRRVRATRFTPARQQSFLDVFAATADFNAAAEAAGVVASTVYKAIGRDPDFARRKAEAQALAVVRLEDEAVRARLAAAEQLRDGIAPEGEISAGFERTMKLLAHYQRKEACGGGASGGGWSTQRRGDYQDALRWLDDRLRAMGIGWGVHAEPIPLPRPGPAEGGEAE